MRLRRSPLRRTWVAGLIALAVLALVGCGTGIGVAPTTEATVGVRLDGEPLRLLVAGPDGMRGRPDFGGADGMLFDLGAEVDPASVVFVMDRVEMPLDIAWFDAAGRLVGRATMTPCVTEPCRTYAAPGPYRWAIEAPAGAFATLSDDVVLEPGADIGA